ncbi:50S ribosomal protein L5 [soil metagenome]
MHPFVKLYQDVAVPKLKENFSYASPYTIPKIEKVVVNVGLGDVLTNSGTVDQVAALLTKITGQKSVPTKARKAVAGFKIRQGMVVGLKTTLRGERMHDFLQKLSVIALPRSRDFRGLNPGAITPNGSLHIGIKDSMIFPEVAQENLSHPLQVTLVASTSSLEEAQALYEALGFVFQGKN